MYEVSIERGFRASHALLLRGQREPVHWHEWNVVVTFAGESLDDDGLLVDFHALEPKLDAILLPWVGKHLNDVLPARFSNASAEQVAACIAEHLMQGSCVGATLRRVSVTEAPGCVASYVV